MSFDMDSDVSDSDISDSEDKAGFEFCSRRNSYPGVLQFDPSSLEKLILSISDAFDFRVVMSNEKVRGAVLMTAGLALAGGLLGKTYGGKIGAALGGAVGGACGLGIVAISMRDAWKEIRTKLADVFDLVYDYLAGLGIKDYVSAAMFIASKNLHTKTLAMMILQTSSELLGKEVLSSLTALTNG